MESSLYSEFVTKFFAKLVTSVTELLNEKHTTQLPYLYKQYLTPDFTADSRWVSILAKYNRVAADVVALDSELPLKSRDVIETASGDIPKLGLKLYLTEKQMKDIDSMIAQRLPINTVINKIFQDTPKVIESIYERIEDIFLSELSTGVGLSARNNGTGVRIDMHYLPENQFGVSTIWGGNPTTCKPISDLERVFDKASADQNNITDIFADDTWLKGFYKADEVKSVFAFASGFVGSNIPDLSLEQATSVLKTKFGVNFHRVNRSIKTEINGIQIPHKPWANGVCALTCDSTLGSLIWTNVAESTRPVSGVSYQTTDDFILVSKYSSNDPLREFTSSQAMCCPVINNVNRIYTLNSTQIQA